ncbi:MAG: carbohydrate kinase family protein [Ignavibacteria bacterium]|nr:carbohydrate kinase family protein [Ignavibacteria bacterium]
MKYIVIGEPCVDIIHKPDGSAIHSYGGILYSIISLAILSKPGDMVKPVMNLGEDEFENITSFLKKYSNIELSGINKVKHPTRKVNLYYTTYKSGLSARFETSTHPTYPLKFEEIMDLIGLSPEEIDAILINMVSGIDITLESMLKIRQTFKSYIHLDVHNLVMKTNPDGTRVHTNLRNWRQWCLCANTVQMNEFEVKSMSASKKNEYEIVEELLINAPKTLEKIFHKNNITLMEFDLSKVNLEGIVITKGADGVSGYQKKEKKYGNKSFVDLDKFDVGAIENHNLKDTTGCGDVFASAFMLSYANNRDFIKSLHYANRIASLKTSIEGIENLYQLK